MNVICLKDVVVSGITVYNKDQEYEVVKVSENNKITSYEITGERGVGVFSVGDPQFKKHFKEVKSKNNLLSFFKKSK